MRQCPFLDQTGCVPGQAAFRDLASCNAYAGFIVTIFRMKVGRWMFVQIHANRDAVEGRNCRHDELPDLCRQAEVPPELLEVEESEFKRVFGALNCSWVFAAPF